MKHYWIKSLLAKFPKGTRGQDFLLNLETNDQFLDLTAKIYSTCNQQKVTIRNISY